MIKKLLIICVAITLTACSQPETAQKVLASQGFTKIQTQGWGMFGCGQDDTFSTKFTAVGAKGENVSGVVCGGWMKGSTVRFD